MKELKVLHPMTRGDDGEGGVVSLVVGDDRPTRLAQFRQRVVERTEESYVLMLQTVSTSLDTSNT
jgi:hypothetical protein